MLTDEDVERIAKKIIEIQKNNYDKSDRKRPIITDIRKKYHDKIYNKFGATGTIEDAIRVVATYKCGSRYVSRIPYEKYDEYVKYMEKLYEDILGIED